MPMRTCVVVSIMLFAACGGKKADGTAGGGSTAGSSGSAGSAAAGSAAAAAGSAAGSGSAGSAAAPKAGYCVPADVDNTLVAFAADDKTATFCLRKEGDEKAAPACTAVELATGAYRAAAAPPPPAPASDAFAVKQEAKGVQVCRGNACKKLDLPRPKVADGELQKYQVSVSDDGKRVVATGGGLDGVAFLDGGTGKKLKSVKLGDDSTCLEGARFVGESVYVATSNCAGPGGSALLYTFAGKKIGEVATEDKINVYGAEPIHVGGDNWAVVGYGGGDVLVFSAKTGKQVHLIEVKQPEDCEQCGLVLGTAAQWSAAPIAKLSSGKLVTLAGAGVSILDPATGKVEKTHALPICPAKP